MDTNSVLVGGGIAIVAALIGAWATLRASATGAEAAFRNALEVGRQERQAAHNETRLAALEALATEFELNAVAVQEAHIVYAHAPLVVEARLPTLPFLASLPEHLRAEVQNASHALARYNALAEYSNTRESVGGGHFDQAIAEQVQNVRELCWNTAQRLREHLGPADQ